MSACTDYLFAVDMNVMPLFRRITEQLYYGFVCFFTAFFVVGEHQRPHCYAFNRLFDFFPVFVKACYQRAFLKALLQSLDNKYPLNRK